MGVKLFVKEVPLDGSQHRRKWIVDVDQGTDFNYRGRTSSNAFFFGRHKRNYNGDVLYHAERLEEAKETSEIMIKCESNGINFDDIP